MQQQREKKVGTHWKPDPNAAATQDDRPRGADNRPERRDTYVTGDGWAIRISEELMRVRRFSYQLGHFNREKKFVPWIAQRAVAAATAKLLEVVEVNAKVVAEDEAAADKFFEAKRERDKKNSPWTNGRR